MDILFLIGYENSIFRKIKTLTHMYIATKHQKSNTFMRYIFKIRLYYLEI